MEFLNGPSPLERDKDGELQYTVPNPPLTKKRKPKKKTILLPPELDESPTCWKKFHFMVYKLVSSSRFEGFITACIMFNTVLMSIEHHNMSKSLESITELFNYVSIKGLVVDVKHQ